MKHVTQTFDTPWTPHQIEGSKGFEFIFNILGNEYTDAYNLDIVRVAVGGYSPLHIDPDNHAFYIVSGEGDIDIADSCHHVLPGAVVRIPRGVVHAIRNRGESELVLLTIYDPPRVRAKKDGVVIPVDQADPD
ncbi:cupin domain-containing protein [Cupriavidus sp. CV2]|uniref:cupin domain-containing protein n=1 Tax=Cupriavidus ulmosensis TaxID=3065913 RepID=UPI00296AB153|nr:cupin domain-containing protein [Cupriavidus sp. CV2]MDW3688816.1 cupin domain-containing protein [Cupriavidus sp. CV2]